ncbi:uncharacterized protein F5Z01DRAFT_166033 [Emericellopsis atlantica]|uniref:Uncharacterized protein n=1 Tax=Emericellopsis atlantica TaxID=2614577 RepID=A0A9P7ZJQ6_9HYPO|nr:uncharacterized protein F5Z01DRAFT_166033 [Emericellopsis atlantica]KAG9253388.1 hypothetical protein F5Z01DRAFT_166033 [Emericellopsis atlantica]
MTTFGLGTERKRHMSSDSDTSQPDNSKKHKMSCDQDVADYVSSSFYQNEGPYEQVWQRHKGGIAFREIGWNRPAVCIMSPPVSPKSFEVPSEISPLATGTEELDFCRMFHTQTTDADLLPHEPASDSPMPDALDPASYFRHSHPSFAEPAFPEGRQMIAPEQIRTVDYPRKSSTTIPPMYHSLPYMRLPCNSMSEAYPLSQPPRLDEHHNAYIWPFLGEHGNHPPAHAAENTAGRRISMHIDNLDECYGPNFDY